MNIWELIGRSYALPFQKLGALGRVFWMPALLWIGMTVVLEVLSALPTEELENTVEPQGNTALPSTGMIWSAIALYFYQSFVMASGLIRWHLFLVKDEPPVSSQFWLFGQEWLFWWRWFLLGLLVTLMAIAISIGLLLSALFFPVDVSVSDKFGDFFATKFASVLAWSLVIAMALIGWLYPRTFLSLAAVAIGERESYRATAKALVSRTDCSLIALATLVTTAPFILAGMSLQELFPGPIEPGKSVQANAIYIFVTSIVAIANFMAFIVFATMLSLFYRERVTPAQAVTLP